MSRDSFGDVTAEYLALRTAAGLVSGLHEAVSVTGGDAFSFLQSLVSQDLQQPEGSVVRSFLLGPQGKLRALLWVLIGSAEFVLVTDAGSGSQLTEDLRRYRIRVDAEVSDPVAVGEVWGPAARDTLGGSIGEGWQRDSTGWTASIPLAGLDRILTDALDESALVDRGAVRVGRLAATTVRIEAGEPVMPTDVDESTIPQETGLVEESVSFTKGCYLGQELVARIDSRGRVNRHLRGLIIKENLLPPTGAPVYREGDQVGELGSVGESLNLRAPVALGLLRREVNPGDEVQIRWDGGATVATVGELPLFTDV